MKPQKKRSLLLEAGWTIQKVVNYLNRQVTYFIPPPVPTMDHARMLLPEAWALYKQGGVYRKVGV